MIVARVTSQGGLRTEAVHLATGQVLEMDAPTDNNGKGERFSPTDLAAASLAACMLTIMEMFGSRHGIDLRGATATVEKVMAAAPRRIAEIRVVFELPEGSRYTSAQRQVLERAAAECPVAKSLHPDLKQVIEFKW